jgi:methanogenic corrinoid protein MtbC1
MNISTLVRHGHKISKLAPLCKEELAEKIQEISYVENGHDSQIENLIVAMIEMDEAKFDKVLTSIIIKEGFENSVFNVIYPFFDKIGLLWQTGTINPAQEHFISNLVKQKMYVAIDGVQNSLKDDYKTFVLFLPEWEMHELGLLMYNYLIKSRGHKVVYLGQNVPYEDIQRVQEIHTPDYLFTSFSFAVESEKLENYIGQLSTDFKGTTVLVTGFQTSHLDKEVPENLVKVKSAAKFRDEFLSNL